MSALVMAIIGCIAGFALDMAIARLAREPFERREEPDDGSEADSRPAHHALDLASETGAMALALPWTLTDGAAYRRIIVVGVTTLLFALVGRQYAGHPLEIAIVALYASALLVCAVTDIIAFRVPNVVSYPAILGALAVGMLMPDANRLDVAVGGLLAGGLFLICALLPGGPMGMGDVKLAFFIGFALGLGFVVQAMLIMAVTGGVVAGVLLIQKLIGRRSAPYMFYAPFISLGAIVVMLTLGTAFRTL